MNDLDYNRLIREWKNSYSFEHADLKIIQHSIKALKIKSYQKLVAATKQVGVAKHQTLTIRQGGLTSTDKATDV